MSHPRTITIQDSLHIPAPLERLFALSTSVPVVQRTLGFRPVEGVITGRVQMGSRVLWKGWLFGLPQRHLTLITGYTAPHQDTDGITRAFFQDTQEAGRFQIFQHGHHLTSTPRTATNPDGGTLLEDEIRYSLPLGAPGYLVAKHIMEPFIRRTLRSRFQLLRHISTTDEWHQYL